MTRGRSYSCNPLLERLAEPCEDVPPARRQFVQEAHARVRPRHLARQRELTAADPPHSRDGMLRGPTWAAGDQGRAPVGAAGDTMHTGGVEGFGHAHRSCSVCAHPACATIDNGLVTGQSLRAISAAYGVSKSALDRHKESHLPALRDQDGADLKREFQAARQADRQCSQQLRWDARAVMRAMQGWRDVRTVEEWQAACEDARERYQSGRFLLERLGAERFLDPQLMATLWQVRQGLLQEYGAESPAMTMVIDLAAMTYANALRVKGWDRGLGAGDRAGAVRRRLAQGQVTPTLRPAI